LKNLVIPGTPPNSVGNYPAVQNLENTNAPGGPFGFAFGSGFNDFGGVLPRTPIVKRAVLCSPLLASATNVVNAADLAGNIAVFQRDTANNNTLDKARSAQAAGAVAIIVCRATNEDALYGGTFGGVGPDVTIPVLVIGHAYGTNLVAAATATASSPVILRLGDDSSFAISEYNGGRGANTGDMYKNVNVTQAGVYPMRMLWVNGGGDNAVEWWTENGSGVRVPVNATNSPVKAYRARTVSGGPPNITSVSASGGNVTIAWSGVGELEEAFSVTGPWQKCPYQNNPAVVPLQPLLGGASFFRIRQY
jgi:hypothetical protein